MNEKYFYSATTRGFYLESLKELYSKSSDGWPDDAVELAPEEYKRLFDGQSKGKVIQPGEDGAPVISERAEASRDDEILIAEMKKSELNRPGFRRHFFAS